MPRYLRAVRVPRVQRPPPAAPPPRQLSPFLPPFRQAVPLSRRDEGFELADAPLDRPNIGALDPVDAELLHGERGADGAVEDRPAQGAVIKLPRPGEVAEQPARERVARARGIAHFVERVGRRPENAVRGEKQGAVLGALDDDGARTEREYLACRFEH